MLVSSELAQMMSQYVKCCSVGLYHVLEPWIDYPNGHTTLLRRWINVNDVDSTSQQRRVPSEYTYYSAAVFSYKLRYIVGFWLVEIAISTNQKPTIYRNLYENTGPATQKCAQHDK